MNKRKLVSVLSSTAIFLSLHSMAPSASANSQTLNNLEEQQKELQQEQNQIKGNISDAEQEMQSLNSERQQLNNDIAEIQTNIDNIIAQISEQEKEIARLEEEINKLNKEIEILQEKIARRNAALEEQARGVQTTGSPQNVIDIILSAESLTELIGKMEVINLIVQNNNNIMEQQIEDRQTVERTREQVDLAKEETNRVKEEMEINRNELVSQRQDLDNKIQIVTEKYHLTSDERDTLLSQQRDVAAQTDKINSEMAAERERIAAVEAQKRAAEAEAKRIAQEEVAKQQAVQASSSQQSSTPSPAPTPTPEVSNGWIRPASGYISSEFGIRADPFNGAARMHSGIDIAGGGPIVAANSGTVTVAGWHYQWGNYVKINHGGGVETLYAHMQSDLRVSAGQSVQTGQHLGTMGTTGSSTGIHLHFEVYQNGTRVNPRNYVNF